MEEDVVAEADAEGKAVEDDTDVDVGWDEKLCFRRQTLDVNALGVSGEQRMVAVGAMVWISP